MFDRKMICGTAFSAFARLLFLLSVPDLIHSLGYPVPATTRLGREPVIQLPIPVPLTADQGFIEYQPTDYDESFSAVPRQDEEEYTAYDRSPILPVYRYYPGADRQDGMDADTFGYVEERPASDTIRDIQVDMSQEDGRKEETYPYGQETWFEGENDGNAEANAAFLQNLILSQMYLDSGHPVNFKYEDDGRDDREWSYGIPVTEVEDDEEPRSDDVSVKELESLKGGNAYSNKGTHPKVGAEGKEDIFQQLQKQLNRNSRKNVAAVAEGLKLSKKQILPSRHPKLGEELRKYYRNQIDGRGKSTANKEVTNKKYKQQTTTTTTPTATEKPTQRRGQKEFVLPRPANPVRKPYDISARSAGHANPYNTIKKLLNMEEALKQGGDQRIQKRVVLSSDQLTSELSGLKKTSV